MTEAYFLYAISFPNGKRYIGISFRPPRRFREHLADARKGSDLLVHRAIRKYGSAAEFKVLVAGPRSYILELEAKVIAAFSTRTPHGYNVSYGGDSSPMQSPEVRAKVAASMRRRYEDPEARRQNRETQKIVQARPELRAKRLAYRATDETKAKLRASKVGKRLPRTPEWQAKLDGARKGKKRSAESLARMSAGQKRRIRTPEEIARMTVMARSKKMTAEYREKLRVAALARWASERGKP